MLPMLSAIAPLAKILFTTIEKSIPDKDFNKAKQGMEELVGTQPLPMLVKGVIIEMVFQLGKTGVSKFKNMFAALNEYDYTRAAAEMLNSVWYRQTPSRCEELANLVRKCEI